MGERYQDLIEQWVIVGGIRGSLRDIVPSGGQLLVYLYGAGDDVWAWFETAIVVLGERVTPFGKRYGDAEQVIVHVSELGGHGTALSEGERRRLGLPVRPPLLTPPDHAPGEDADALLERGIHFDQMDQPELAEDHMRAAIRASGGEPFFMSNYATFLINRGRFAEGVDVCTSARAAIQARLGPDADDPERWLLAGVEVQLGEALLGLGRRSEGLALLEPWSDHPDHGPEVAEVLAANPER